MLSDYVQDVSLFGKNDTLDQAIMDKLPPGCRVLSASQTNQSLWVKTIKIVALLPDSSTKAYFGKVAIGDAGREMMHGAYESEQAVYSFIPEYVPEPAAWGSFHSHEDTHFYIEEYVEMENCHPGARAWATVVSTLHQRSMGKSPNGKFGFHIDGHLANIPVRNGWDSSWEKFWTQQFLSLCEEEEARCGEDASFTQIKKVFCEKVIPRYLRPLGSDGRSVQPCLCVFDSASYWGHFEADLSGTGPNLWDLEEAGEAYREIVAVSEPQDEYEQRRDIYGIPGMVLQSAMYSKEAKRRHMCAEAMQKLIDTVLLAPTLRKIQSESGQGNGEEAEQSSLIGA